MTVRTVTPGTLLRDFGSRTPIARDAVGTLFETLLGSPPEVLARWKAVFGQWAGQAADRVPRHVAKLARQYGASTCGDANTLLFALQTYYAMVVNVVAGESLLDESPFGWYRGPLLDRLRETLVDREPRSEFTTDDGCDLFKPLYQDIFPRPLRHALGEYYTPDWLAAHVLDQVGYTGEPGQRLLDPACGSGTFLMMALRRLRARGKPIEDGAASPIVGFDLNPLAVMTARANYLIAAADLLPRDRRVEPPVYLCDSILGIPSLPCAAEPFDLVVGNPPWIAWDNLPDDDRQATKPLWERYGLFSLSGNAARHGGGKKDLSMLMLYAAADRYLKPGGRLGMVITQTLFQTKGAGDGFRRFRLGADGPPLGVLRVDDMVAVRPFDDAANWTSAIVLEKGAATQYPVPYFKWSERETNDECGMMNDECGIQGSGSLVRLGDDSPSLVVHPFHACPIDPTRPNSPWLILPEQAATAEDQDNGSSVRLGSRSSVAVSRADYSAHLGANSGGANGVYWIEVLRAEEGGVRVRNRAARGKRQVEMTEQVVEPELLYPLLRWSDVARYAAVPRGHILLAQDPTTRTGIEQVVMSERYPRALRYLDRFRELLSARAAYRRYQDRSPFYSMYNVGPYTVAPIKVVWRRMDRRINAAVVEEADDPLLGRRSVIPQETCVLVACESADEAHYVCAMLNSAVVNELVAASSVCGGKGFGTPGMLDYVPLRRYRADDPRHAELTLLSRRAHRDFSEAIQRDIDRLAMDVLVDRKQP